MVILVAIACSWLIPQCEGQDDAQISLDGLREVNFFFDADAPGLRRGSAELAARLSIQVTGVMVTSCKWQAGDKWLIEGDYELKDGELEINSVQDYSGTSLHRSIGTRRLAAGLGTFRLLYQLQRIDGKVRSNDLLLGVKDRETGESVRYVIDIFADRPPPDDTTAPDGEDEEVLKDLTREFVKLFCTEEPTPLSRLPKLLGASFTHVESSGKLLEGRKEGIRSINRAVESLRKNYERFEEKCDIRSCSVFGDTAVVVAKLDMTGVPPPREPLHPTAMETFVFCRREARWRLIHTTLAWLGKPSAASERPTAAKP